MKKNAAVPLVLLLAVLASVGAPAAVAQPLDTGNARIQAEAFLTKVRLSIAAGSQTEAEDLLDSALQLAPDYSEALYLRARLELADRGTTLKAIDDLQRALSEASWTVTDPAAAGQALAEVLLRTGRLSDAQAVLLKLAALNPADQRTELLLAELYQRENDAGALRRTLSDAVLKFPLDDDFAVLSARQLEREGRKSAARQVIATQLDVHPQSLPLLLQAAELAAGAAARVAAVDRYAGQGGADPLAAVLALEAPSRDQRKYLSQFVENGGLSRENLVERVAKVVRGSKGLSAAFQSALSAFSGNRDLDPQGDGYYEERWTFETGALTSWVRDAHKDGLPELAAEFRNGTLTSLTIRTGADSVYTMSYSTYPYVESVKAPASSGSLASTFWIVPFTLKFPFLANEPPSGLTGLAPRAVSSPGSPSTDQIQRASYMTEQYASDGTVARRIDLLRGKRVFMGEDTLGKGAFDHRVWYQDGQPVRGARDLDGSGRFAVSETWRDGRLAGIAVDTDGDGKVDYRERYVPSPMKSWDYNEDGIDDSRQYPAGPDTVVRDFSTAMNGVFDIRYEWRKGELVSVTRRGQAVSVTHDAARGVVWIGLPAAGGEQLDTSGAEGYRTISGKQYLVFRQDGVTYVEALP